VPFFISDGSGGTARPHVQSDVAEEMSQVQENVGKIAILAKDHYEDPELWRILWRALLISNAGETTGHHQPEQDTDQGQEKARNASVARP
jgi:hypothetical protein